MSNGFSDNSIIGVSKTNQEARNIVAKQAAQDRAKAVQAIMNEKNKTAVVQEGLGRALLNKEQASIQDLITGVKNGTRVPANPREAAIVDNYMRQQYIDMFGETQPIPSKQPFNPNRVNTPPMLDDGSMPSTMDY